MATADMDLITSIPPKISRRGPHGDDVGVEYLRRCVESWRKNGFSVETLNRAKEAEQVRRLSNLEPVIFEDDSGALYKDRYGPSFYEMFSNRDLSRPVCIANADVYLLDSGNISSTIEDLCQSAFLFAHRTDFIGSEFSFPSNYKQGVDFVAFRPDRLLPLLNDRGFARFKMGVVWWDYVMPIAASFFMPVRRIREPFILHHMHERAWDSETYRQVRLMALDVLRRTATGARRSSQAAALFAERAGSLDVTTKKDAQAFFELCTDWLAGRIGPVGELQLPLDSNQEALTQMLRSALEQSTIAQSEIEERRRVAARLERHLAKRDDYILKLRFEMKGVTRANARLRKALLQAKIEEPTNSATDLDDDLLERAKGL